MTECVAKQFKTPWYHWDRFPILPILKIKNADQHNTWGFYFHWLVFMAWTMDDPEMGFIVMIDDQYIQIQLRFPYLITGIFIPISPRHFSQMLWRKPKRSK